MIDERSMLGLVEFSGLGVAVAYVAGEMEEGRIGAQSVYVNNKKYLIEGQLTPYPHVNVIDVEQLQQQIPLQ